MVFDRSADSIRFDSMIRFQQKWPPGAEYRQSNEWGDKFAGPKEENRDQHTDPVYVLLVPDPPPPLHLVAT